MLIIPLLQSREISFQWIGRRSNLLISEIMEHIGKSFKQHASCALNIAKNPTMLWFRLYTKSIFIFPSLNSLNKLISFSKRMNQRYSKKDFSERSGICSFRICSTPSQPLTLDMNQASLKSNVWPYETNDLHHMGIPINCCAMGKKSFVFNLFTEIPKIGWALRAIQLRSNDSMSLCIHNNQDTLTALQKSSIQYNVPDRMKPISLWDGLMHPIMNNPTYCRDTMSTLYSKLSKGIAFGNPAFKPNSVLQHSVWTIADSIAVFTSTAVPALFTISCSSISLKCMRTTC